METQGSTKTNNDQFSELGERIARIETKMDRQHASQLGLNALEPDVALRPRWGEASWLVM